jgi:chromosome partitioning protein
MPIFSCATLKGGCGKTTTAINLAAALQRQGKTVLLIDSDPQSNLSQSLGIVDDVEKNLFTELSKEIAGEGGQLSDAIVQTSSGIDVIPSSIELAGAELELVSVYGREQMFTWMLENLKDKYDYIFIDCPPSIGMLTVNALVASNYILIPMPAEYLPLRGVRSFMAHLKAIKKLNKHLEIFGFVITRYDERKTMNRQIKEELESEFGEKIFQTHIRSNIQLANAQQAGMDIFSFDKYCHGAEDYHKLAEEFLQKIISAGKEKIQDKQLTGT